VAQAFRDDGGQRIEVDMSVACVARKIEFEVFVQLANDNQSRGRIHPEL
jgi:hypothetical protein